MSAIILVPKSRSLDVVSDAAGCRADTGAVWFMRSKQFRNPKQKYLVAGAGRQDVMERLADVCLETRLGFDDLLPMLPFAWAKVWDELKPREQHSVCFVAGWSASRSRPEVYSICDWDRSHRPAHVWTPRLLSPYALSTTGTTPLCREFIDQFDADPDSFDAERDGLALLEKFRRVPKQWRCAGAISATVGGFAEATTISEAGLAHRVIHQWPDRLGEPIALEAA